MAKVASEEVKSLSFFLMKYQDQNNRLELHPINILFVWYLQPLHETINSDC
jgi:hypothetical protein